MSKRKVAVSHNVRINVGNYQHIDCTFYSEEEIEYDSPEERVAKEDAVNDDVVSFLIRSVREIPDRLGKKTEAVQEVEESIKKTIPKWLAEDPVPNLANKAKSEHDSVTAEQKELKDSQTDDTLESEFSKIESKSEPEVKEVVPEEEVKEVVKEEPPKEAVAEEEVKEEEKPKEKASDETDEDDLFDEDLFE